MGVKTKALQAFLLSASLLSASGLFAWGTKEQAPSKARVEGFVRLVGNEPFTRLVVTTKEGKTYYFENDKKKAYSRFIGLLVVVEGLVEEKSVESAAGKFLGTEYTLKNAEIKEAVPRTPSK